MPWLIGTMIVFVLGAGGYAADKTGEGINDAGTGLLKLAAAGGLFFYMGRKLKWI